MIEKFKKRVASNYPDFELSDKLLAHWVKIYPKSIAPTPECMTDLFLKVDNLIGEEVIDQLNYYPTSSYLADIRKEVYKMLAKKLPSISDRGEVRANIERFIEKEADDTDSEDDDSDEEYTDEDEE